MIRRLVGALRRNTILILLCLAIALGAAYVVTEQETPQYASTTRVLVSSPASSATGDTDVADSQARTAVELATTYADVVDSQVLATRVVDRLLGDPAFRGDANLQAETLQGQVSAEVVPGVAVIRIFVTDPDPGTAQVVAQAYAEELIATAADIEAGDFSIGADTDLGDARFTVVDFASFNDLPVSPQPVRTLLLAGGAGLLLGLLLVGFREGLRTSSPTEGDIAALAGAPVLATIVHESARSRRRLVTDLDQDASRAEAFRMLSTTLKLADHRDDGEIDFEAAHQVVVVASAGAGEGASSTAVDLALTSARSGVRTLLLDGDLRRPRVASIFDLDGSAGVTTVLLGKVALEEALWTHPGTGLVVLPSGVVPPNPAELLATTAMSHLLDRVRSDYEVVVVDGAPLDASADAALLAARADGTLLVVRLGRATEEQVRTAVERLRSVSATTVGVVLTGVPKRRRPH